MTFNPRILRWDGCSNVRDLGGLRVSSGGETRRGALVRADALEQLTTDGWSALLGHGVRSVIDLRNPEERAADRAERPKEVVTVNLPLEDELDDDFWNRWRTTGMFATPLYFSPFVQRFPHKISSLIHTIATCQAGGIAIHCRIGRDRTGLASLVLLKIADVLCGEIADDYLCSNHQLSTTAEHFSLSDDVDQLLAKIGDTQRSAVERACASLDGNYLEGLEGSRAADFRAVRERLAPL